MRHWLKDISLFEDIDPHSAALNMAIDEALLPVIPGPVLRVYRWAKPAVSFGCFERWEPIRAAHPAREPVRRWTGGGVVLHGDDLTYSLLIPHSREASAIRPANSYCLIHGALRSALADFGITAATASAPAAKISRDCFENPVLHDVLVNGCKIAGAAQRRSRAGLIHQGSIRSFALPPAFPAIFAGHLAGTVRRQNFDVSPAAEKLAAEKYATRGWLERRL